jgi:hypothetical protein
VNIYIILFVFSDPFDYFLLDAKSGELRTAKPLDREALENVTGIITFVMRAREIVDGQVGNDNSMISLAEATVTIKDVNDEPPSFNHKEYTVFIPENIADGTPLPHLDMMVRDPDVVSHTCNITGSINESIVFTKNKLLLIKPSVFN